MAEHQVVIVGGGPAGLTAGLYASRAGLKCVVLERGIFGGQMVNATLVENYPGFPQGISGFDLGSFMHDQAVRYGLETVDREVTGLVPGQPLGVATTEGAFDAESIIIATGSEYRKLGVAGEQKMVGRGISYCATCDGFLFRDQKVAVVGGGDTALTDALELAQHAERIYLIHRRDELRAGTVLQQRAFAQPKIEFLWDTVIDEIIGEQSVTGLRLRNVKTGQDSILGVGGVFVAVGLKPNSECFAKVVNTSETRHIITDESMATSLAGVFAAGDIRHNSPRQIATAVGDGATAAMSVFRYLRG